MAEVNLLDTHPKTVRDYNNRALEKTPEVIAIAKKFDKVFFDGDRRYGYGGYKYDGRWAIVAKKLITRYNLSNRSKILDVGCGKGYLLYEIKKLLPQARVCGFDISRYGLRHAKEEIRKYLRFGKAEGKYPYKNKEFDLVISITTLHNLALPELSLALSEIERVGKRKYVAVESWRNEKKLF